MKNFKITNTNGIKLKTSNKYIDDDINVLVDSTNLVSENIKNGVEILGVTGTFEGGIPGTRYYIPDSSNKYQLDIVADDANLNRVDITSSIAGDTAVNIYATEKPTNVALNGGSNENLIGTVNIDDTNYTGSIIADNLVPETIAKGIKILGVTGIMQSSSGSSTETTLKTLLDATQSAYYLFHNYSGTSIDGLIKKNDTTNIKDTSYMFNSCKNLTSIPELNTINVTNMQSMFNGCTSLTSIPQLNTSKVTTMQSMFNGCTSLTSIPQLDTINVLDMSGVFWNCPALQTIPQLNTSKVTTMQFMFNGCTSLTSIPQLDTINVNNMKLMFYNCFLLKKIDITYMHLSDISNSYNFAYSCYSLTKVIIRYMTKVPALNKNSFSGCYHILGTKNSTYNPNGLKDGRIYVPDDMVDTLKSATNWATYADIIVPLSTLEE